MFTRETIHLPTRPEPLETGGTLPDQVARVLDRLSDIEQRQYDFMRSVKAFIEGLNRKGVLNITQAKIQDSTLDNTPVGATTPAAGTFASLTTTGNNILGDAQADTLNVGAGDIIKDAAGVTGFGVTPGAWDATAGNKAIQVGTLGSFASFSDSLFSSWNARFDGSNWKYLATNKAASSAYATGTGFVWRYTASGSAGATITWTTVATLDESGNYAPLGYLKPGTGKTLNLSSTGANPVCGNATLVGGTITVSTTAVTANSLVLLTRKTSGGTIGTAITYTISAGTSFTINSDNILDTSTFSWVIVEKY